MRTLANIPESIKQTFTVEEKEAIKLLEQDAQYLEAYFQLETGEFDCIGFIGPGGKVTKYAEPEKYNALLILENKIREELKGKIRYDIQSLYRCRCAFIEKEEE